MKKYLYIITLLACLFTACDPKPAVFNLQSKNFGPNAVISIQSSENNETLKAENITNGNQTFKINIPKKGYAILTTQDGENKEEYYFYLDKGNYNGILDGKNTNTYPLKNVPTPEGEEFIDFYKLKENMGKSLFDSLAIVEHELDIATPGNIAEKAKNADIWREKKNQSELGNIQAFAKKHPKSEATIFLLDRFGRADSETKKYLSIFKSLDPDVQESKKGKKLLAEIMQANQMMAGSKMPNIEGETPDGKKFDLSVLKKLNLVICWVAYSGKSRKNNQVLVDLYEKYKRQNVEFIGVSYDKNKDSWEKIIKADKLTWPQYSDLLGAKSSNAKNLSNYDATYFFLVDKNGTVLSNNDLSLDFVDSEISKHLAGRE
ncbi:peroxiredoxin family protein [Pedobacter sp. UBA5917]|jgi:peroxiredoxin|uniref:peroxiredoxin family protein n=1 Tax=Pedobacter sp. UBA5917 TaxID=1947061 RepID=UPI0025F8426E|nr:thioredoxin family protein [Pedobacter sp. UBA5917]